MAHDQRIPEAIRRSMRILARHRTLFGGRRDSRVHRKPSTDESEIVRVVGVFDRNRASWALVGAHAVALVTEPRATDDFDFIVEGTKLPAIIRDLTIEFGELDPQDIGGAIQLKAIDIDLIRSTNHPLFAQALEHVRTLGDWRVPETEVLIALKFLSAVSPWRNPDKRAQDIVDLRTMYRTVGPGALDVARMTELAGLAYPDAEREFRSLLHKIDRGQPISI